MARPIEIRASYSQDAAFFIRLQSAIEKDSTQSPEWKRKANELLSRLTILFLEADRTRSNKTGK